MENRAGQAIPDSPFTIPDEQKRAKPGRLHAQAWLDFSSLRTLMSRINQTLGSAEPDEMGTAWCIFIFDPGPKSKWTPDQRTSLCCQGDAILALLDFDGRAGGFEVLLELRRVVLADRVLHGCRSRLDEVLRFLEAEARDRA